MGDNLEVVDTLGAGGMGEVFRVYDRRLHRTLAMKVLHHYLAEDPDIRARFIAEAQATAQLTHPGIVPVHEVGELTDGRPFFTMRLVTGHTFAEIIDDDGVTTRRLVDILRRVADAVAYAHSRGVTHHDLKPANAMIGAFGEVQVVDWGLLRIGAAEQPIIVDHEEDRPGSVRGTPAYMAPEQARGEATTKATDVYALGCMLWEILTGSPPYGTGDPKAILQALRDSPPDPLPDGVPLELEEICTHATQREPQSRYANGAQFAMALTDWLEGARRSERARTLLDEATKVAARVEDLTREHERAMRETMQLKRATSPRAPVEKKRPFWSARSHRDALKTKVTTTQREREELMLAALRISPDEPAVLDTLADYHRALHSEAEHDGDQETSTHHLAALARYNRGQHDLYLSGASRLKLQTEVPAAATLWELQEVDQRRTPHAAQDVGTTPLDLPVASGSYLLELHAPGRQTVRVPVCIEREREWHQRDPIGNPHPTPLPLIDELGANDVLVPASWGWAGAHPSRTAGAWTRHQRWVDSFVSRRFPVTNTEYIAFLDALVDDNREAEALRWAPRDRGSAGEDGVLRYGRDANGHFILVADGEGDLWDPDWPVICVTWESACAYAAWLSESTGLDWRLPSEHEWARAARGVDGRPFPWGDRPEQLYSAVRESFAGRPCVVSVYDYPGDESVYGVRGCAGNVREWCAERYHHHNAPTPPTDEPGSRVVRGGSFSQHQMSCAGRVPFDQRERASSISFRVVRSFRVGSALGRD